MPRPEWLFSDDPIPDPSGRGAAAVRFLNLLQLTEGAHAGKRDWLQPWQDRLVRRIYGDVAESGRRRIRTVFCRSREATARRPSAAASPCCICCPQRESEPAGQTVIAAGDREQASICFNSARRMVQADPRLARITTVTDSLKLIRHPKSDGILKAVSSESYTKMGMSISCLICDELATWGVGDRDLYNALVELAGQAGRADHADHHDGRRRPGLDLLGYLQLRPARGRRRGHRPDLPAGAVRDRAGHRLARSGCLGRDQPGDRERLPSPRGDGGVARRAPSTSRRRSRASSGCI